jgi:hypothetical protein
MVSGLGFLCFSVLSVDGLGFAHLHIFVSLCIRVRYAYRYAI